MVNKKLQCSGQHLLHSDATHRKHVPRRPSTPITPSYPEKRLATCSWLTSRYLRGMWTDKAKQIKLRDPPNTSATFFHLTFPSRTVQQWFINKKPLHLRQNMIFSSLIIDTVLVLGNVQHRLAWATMLTAALLLLPLSTTQWNSSQAAASTSFSHCCNEITPLYHHTRVSHRWFFFSLISRSYLTEAQ